VQRKHVECLVKQCVTLVEIYAKRVELALRISGAGAKDQPAAGQDVDRRGRLGQ